MMETEEVLERIYRKIGDEIVKHLQSYIRAKLTFEAALRAQPDYIQDKILGKKKAELFRSSEYHPEFCSNTTKFALK